MNFYIVIFGAQKGAINCLKIEFFAISASSSLAGNAVNSLPNIFVVSKNNDRPGMTCLQQLSDNLVKISLLVVMGDLQGLSDADST